MGKKLGRDEGWAGYSQDGDSRGLARALRNSDGVSKRGTAVLEAPEQDYAPEFRAPRRTSASPKRKLRRDFSEDFADDLMEDDDVPAAARRGGVRLRLRVGLPRTKWGRIAAGFVVLVLLGICGAAAMLARNAVMHDARFAIPSASAITFAGNVHATRDELLNVFGQDVERNIFHVPLEERQAEVEQLPWVAHATVMRLLPNRIRVSVVERTPVAFVRQGSRIGLVDANGVLLAMPPGAKGDAHYSFPVVTGISASDPLSTRAARMKIFEQFAGDVDGGDKGLAGISEVDLSNPEDVRALISTDSSDILVHFGEDHFLERYQKFEEHLPEWRMLYPKLASVDMRYDTQAVLEMQPGVAQSAGAAAAPGAAEAAPVATHPAVGSTVHPAAKTAAHVAARHPLPKHVVVKRKASVPARRSGAKAGVHAVHATHAAKTKVHAAKRPAKRASKYHSSQAVHP